MKSQNALLKEITNRQNDFSFHGEGRNQSSYWHKLLTELGFSKEPHAQVTEPKEKYEKIKFEHFYHHPIGLMIFIHCGEDHIDYPHVSASLSLCSVLKKRGCDTGYYKFGGSGGVMTTHYGTAIMSKTFHYHSNHDCFARELIELLTKTKVLPKIPSDLYFQSHQRSNMEPWKDIPLYSHYFGPKQYETKEEKESLKKKDYNLQQWRLLIADERGSLKNEASSTRKPKPKVKI